MTQGRNLIVSLDRSFSPIAGAKSCKFSISQDFIKVCSPTEGRIFEKVPTTYDWSLSADCLIPNSNTPNNIIGLLVKGTMVMLWFTDGGGQKLVGYAYVKSCREAGSVGSLATFEVAFESTGPLYTYNKITPTTFTEGMGKTFAISSSGAITIDDHAYDNMYIAPFTIEEGQKLYFDEVAPDWFVSTETAEHIKGYVARLDETALYDSEVHDCYGSDTSKRFISLNAGSYTALFGYEDSMAIFIFTPIK